jgi:hypothetical protein
VGGIWSKHVHTIELHVRLCFVVYFICQTVTAPNSDMLLHLLAQASGVYAIEWAGHCVAIDTATGTIVDSDPSSTEPIHYDSSNLRAKLELIGCHTKWGHGYQVVPTAKRHNKKRRHNNN